jgi:hypothetical protein
MLETAPGWRGQPQIRRGYDRVAFRRALISIVPSFFYEFKAGGSHHATPGLI